MKFNFKSAMEPIIDIGTVAVGAVASNQFLDLGRIFKNADPNNKLIVHQGGVKAGAAILSLMLWHKKMPHWMKMGVVGIGAGGLIKEGVTLSKGKIEKIGAGDGSGSDTSSLDRLLAQAARESISGGVDHGASYVGANDAGAGVGANDAGAGVGANPDIPQMDYGTTVGWV